MFQSSIILYFWRLAEATLTVATVPNEN